MFCLLTDNLPKTVTVDEKEYPVRWRFQHIIKVDIALHDVALDTSERWAVALTLFYGDAVPDNVAGAIEQMCAFMLRDKPKNRAQRNAAERYKNAQPVYSYEHDDEYIFAAFMQLYGINLAREDDMHWYEFLALLHAMDECPFTRIKGYRSADLSKIKDAKERGRMGDLQTYWALPVSAEQQAIEDEIDAILMNDGDLSALDGM